jgi:hypothetical protein
MSNNDERIVDRLEVMAAQDVGYRRVGRGPDDLAAAPVPCDAEDDLI